MSDSSDWGDQFNYKETNFSFFIQGMKNFWWFLGTEQQPLIRSFFWLVLNQSMAICLPYFLKLTIDEIPTLVAKQEITNYFLYLLLAMFGFMFFKMYLWIFVKDTILIKSWIRLENFWPLQAQDKLLALSFSYHEQENTGKKISKITKGCEKMIEICMDISWRMLPQLIYLAINLIFLMVIDWRLGLLFFTPLIPTFFINKKIFEHFADDWELWEKSKEESLGVFHQSLINVKTVQDYVQENHERRRLSIIRGFMSELDIRINMRERYYHAGARIILDFFFLLTIVFSVYFSLQGTSTVGTIVFIIATGNVTIESIHEISHTYAGMLRKLVAVNRMKEIMDADVAIKNKPDAITPAMFTGQVDFQNVTFTYSGKETPVLHDLSLSIAPRQMVAFVGRSGEGKTTAVRLLCRVFDISTGTILLDGHNIKDLDLSWYRRLFAVVQQDVDIFDTSLHANITYPYPDATKEQVLQAIKAAHIEEMINDQEKFPNGLETLVGERGVRLSGGEKQRVGIARAYIALLNGAKFLVLDEATSSVDSETERAIQKMLTQIRRQMDISIVAIAHRLSTIRKADMIYVLDHGQIVESGSHTRLVEKNGLYAKLVELQQLGELRK